MQKFLKLLLTDPIYTKKYDKRPKISNQILYALSNNAKENLELYIASAVKR